jgi:ATP-binding cassette subfamily B protein
MARWHWYRQLDSMDCGPTCLRMVARHHGRSLSASALRSQAQPSRTGISMAELARQAESVGLRTVALRCKYAPLVDKLPLPCIAHWDQRHFVVVYEARHGKVIVADPGCGVQTLSRGEFLRHFCGGDDDSPGVVLLLEPTPEFFGDELPGPGDPRSSLAVLAGYLARHRAYLFQLLIGLFVGSLLSFVLPFLTQSLVDYGVASRDLGFVYVVLAAQLMLFVGRTTIDFIRGWLVLHVGARINIALVADFLVHLMRMPMPFFDARAPGDILQRIDDHRRVEQFLTTTMLNVALGSVLLTVSSIVLFVYSTEIFVVFVTGSAAATAWTMLFMRRRRVLDHKAFLERAASQNTLMQMIEGMGEIKLATCELPRRWDWERIQARLFRLTEKRLQVAQVQQAGSLGVGELKNILITFYAAHEVIAGEMTLGMMLAVAYLLGQANRPLEMLLQAAQSIQDTRVSLERIAEIRDKPPEVAVDAGGLPTPRGEALVIDDLHFGYRSGAPVLKGVSLVIPSGKVTAIVGTSGSGKTTLLKLLLRFLEPQGGSIRVGDASLAALEVAPWRKSCGVVFQDGYVFSDTVARNICLGDGDIDMVRLQAAARAARIEEWVRSLPRGFHTAIGSEGVGLSEGQRQRLLIARAIYKDPQFLFLDEATSALDAENERAIVEGLGTFLRGRTSVVIAHRLSTVRNADNIVVLEGGIVAEQGTHDELVARRGAYWKLVSNQLELAS